jgi:predicted HTH transcriptional regulator
MFVINKSILDITQADIEALITNQVVEGKHLDYKRDTYGNKDDDKKELLKDVSSFANSGGGDLIIGMEETEGLPSKIVGMSIDPDKEILRLESIIRTGISPRLPNCDIHPVKLAEGTYVIIIRITKKLDCSAYSDFSKLVTFF